MIEVGVAGGEVIGVLDGPMVDGAEAGLLKVMETRALGVASSERRRAMAECWRWISPGCWALIASLAGEEARGAVVISSDPSANIVCSGGTCAPTAAEAVLNVTALENLLSSGNVAVVTTGTGGVEANDIIVASALSWTQQTKLTLSAYRSTIFRNDVDVAGPGDLAISYDLGGANGSMSFGHIGHIQFRERSSQLLINAVSYRLVHSIGELSADVARSAGGHYALAENYDASTDPQYQLAPVGTLHGTFEGLGNSISNLSIVNGSGGGTQESGIGLFSSTAGGSEISDLTLMNVAISVVGDPDGAVGGLVGAGAGTLNHDMVTGTIVALDTRAGGLAGSFAGRIVLCRATVDVSASEAGGLVGFDEAIVSRSAAFGRVAASKRDNSLSIAGGLIGTLNGTVNRSYAMGLVSAGHGSHIGGLIGYTSAGGVANSYSLGNLESTSDTQGTDAGAGGLVGTSTQTISTSFSTGRLLSGKSVPFGGFISTGTSVSFSHDYWDTTTSGSENGLAGGNLPGLHGLTTAQLTAGLPPGFDPAIWGQSAGINKGYPYLLENPPR